MHGGRKMKKHLYFHSSNFNYASDIHEDLSFCSAYKYPCSDFKKTFPNEYGRIETNENYFHFIIGSIPHKGCPWCAGETIIARSNENHTIEISLKNITYWVQCVKCGATGPKLHVSPHVEDNQEYKEDIIYCMTERFHRTNMWDHDFSNPYEDQNE
jgi:hypothetical protein